MFTVALIGPDGAGKTTVGRRLEQTLPVPVKYIYMGVNLGASNCLSPISRAIRSTKRWLNLPLDRGPVRVARRDEPRPGPLRRMVRVAKGWLTVSHRVFDEWYRQAVAWFYQQRGHIVVFDRHFYPDYYAQDLGPGSETRPLVRRFHGYVLERWLPKPDLLIYLDAPSEVLLARKGEGTIESLEGRRRDYLRLREVVPHFAIVDANQSLDQVTNEVAHYILDFQRAGNRRPQR